MKIEHTGIVLLVPNKDIWEAKMEKYFRSRKRASWISGFLVIGTVAATSYLVAMQYPLLSGDIAFGHPRYYDYRAGADAALILLVAVLELYWCFNAIFNRWTRRTNVSLGFCPDGSVSDLREAFTPTDAQT